MKLKTKSSIKPKPGTGAIPRLCQAEGCKRNQVTPYTFQARKTYLCAIHTAEAAMLSQGHRRLDVIQKLSELPDYHPSGDNAIERLIYDRTLSFSEKVRVLHGLPAREPEPETIGTTKKDIIFVA